MESYRRIGLAVNADLSFDLSFDRAILNNLGHWLGLQTLARGVPVCADTLPLSDIVLTASRRGPQDLQLAVSFVAQIFMAASSSVAFQPSRIRLELHEERSQSSICAKSRSAIRSVQDVFDATVECYYNREYDDSPGGVLARRGGGDSGTTEI